MYKNFKKKTELKYSRNSEIGINYVLTRTENHKLNRHKAGSSMGSSRNDNALFRL